MADFERLRWHHLSMTDSSYPGDSASTRQMLALADEYCLAAECLHKQHTKQQLPLLAPFRLTAIHAIELYLSAVLLAHGRTPVEIRGMSHDLLKRAQFAQEVDLKLRKRTIKHLGSLSTNREYLVSRYELKGVASPVTQLLATLRDVAKKTKAMIEAAELKPRPAPLCR